MTTKYPRLRRTVPTLGRVQIAVPAKNKRDYDRKVVLFDKLVADSQVAVLRALLVDETVTWDELVDADRRGELQGAAILSNVALAKPLFPALIETLPKMGKAASSRKRYAFAITALKRQTWVPWPEDDKGTPRTVDTVRVRDLGAVEWATLAKQYVTPVEEGGGGYTPKHWNAIPGMLRSFLSAYLKDKRHPAKRPLEATFVELPESERVPDLTPALFLAIMGHVPERIRPSYYTLLLTGLRDISEYLALTREHLRPGICAIVPPGTKTDRSRAPIEVDPQDWPWIDAAVPAPLGYARLRLYWVQACLATGAGAMVPHPRRRTADGTPALTYRGLHLHDLRHALGQWAHDAGQPLGRIKEALRHTNINQTERYARTSATRAVTSAVGDRLRREAL